MQYVENGDLQALYDYILINEDYSLDRTVELPAEHHRYHPEKFYPINEIYNFIDADGPILWDKLKDGDLVYVSRWLKKGGNSKIRHPVTGDTIAHVNFALCRLLRNELAKGFEQELNYNAVEALLTEHAQ